LLSWFNSLTQIVFSFGYPGVVAALIIEGLGLPFPGDVIMAFYGFAAANGQFHILGILVFSVLGYVMGTVLSYSVSRRFGSVWFERVSKIALVNRWQVERTANMIDRHGPWLLVVGRFLPGVRAVSSYVAGMMKMDFQVFLLYTGVGAVLWCAAWVMVGYWFGESLSVITRHIQASLTIGTLSIAGIIALGWLTRKRWAR